MEQPHAAPHGGEKEAAERRPNVPVAPGMELVDIPRLKQYPFLKDCSDIVLRKLQPQFSERRFEPGATILQLGGYSDAAYYIASGVVGVRLTTMGGRREAKAAEAADAPRSMAERIQAVLSRKPSEQAVQRPRTAADGTIILSDLPVDLRSNE